MYSQIKSIQLLAALLKEYGIRDVVLSPGGSDIPIIHSLETDDFFNCLSVVDERSAVYFAMGIAQQKNTPVACVCTSGTAVSNYLPGLTEAFYQDVPIVAITADKEPYRLNQLMLQKIDQTDIFKNVTKKSVNLPVVKNSSDKWYCERLINEALLELNHHGRGPVHINIPITENTSVYPCDTLPKVRKMNLVTPDKPDSVWKSYSEKLKNAKRILVIVGQNVVFTDEDIKNIEAFSEKYNCVFSVEHMSNLKCKGCIPTYRVAEFSVDGMFTDLIPDLLISMGNNISSYKLKPLIKQKTDSYTHWQIDESGRVRDFSDRLTDIFECSPKFFFEYFTKNAPSDSRSDMEYFNAWKQKLDEIEYPDFEFSNMYVAKQLSSIIPKNSVLHLAILNSTRTMQFFDLDPSVRVYSNIGALGIDGCMSTFMGQAASTDELAFCVVGDLSFFYDMNSAGIRHVGSNVRIILVNNGGGSEFHFFMGKRKIPTINSYICAEHQKTAKGWIESLGYDYCSASSKEELDDVLPRLAQKSDKPMFVEVFTDMEKDAFITNSFFHINRIKFGGIKLKFMDKAKSVLKPAQLAKVKKLLGK